MSAQSRSRDTVADLLAEVATAHARLANELAVVAHRLRGAERFSEAASLQLLAQEQQVESVKRFAQASAAASAGRTGDRGRTP